MNPKIISRPRATEEHLATIGHLREAIGNHGALLLLIDLRAAYRPYRDWQNEERHLLERFNSPRMTSLIEALRAVGVSLRGAVSVPLLFKMNAK